MIVVTTARIFWDGDEKQKIIDTAIELYPCEENKDISLRQLFKKAMLAGLPADRHRDLRGVSDAGMAWFTEGLKRRMRQIEQGQCPPTPPAPAPEAQARAGPGPGAGAERPASKRGPHTPPGERVRWDAREKVALIEAAVEAVRRRPAWASLHPRALLREVMADALPPERHRDTTMILTKTLAWFEDGVARGLATPAPGPEAEAGFGDDPEFEREFDLGPEDEPGPEVAEYAAPGTGFAPVRVPTPAPRDQVLSLLAGMNNTDLIGLLLSRLLAERQVDVSALTAMMEEVRALGERLNAFAGQLAGLAGRIAPLEAKATTSNRLLRGVLESLDPGLLRGIEESAPEAKAVPAPPPPAPAPAPEPKVEAAAAPPPPPKPKICVLGVRPEQVARIKKQVNGHATVIGLWGDQAMKHDFGQYNHVITTPNVGGLTVKYVHEQVGKANWTPVRERGTERIAAGVADVADRLEDQWRRAQRN
jgi:hypothetical protein